MVWQARNADNSPRTPSPYVRHDENNAVATAHADYVRHDEDNVADVPQPAHLIQTDAYGNPYEDFNQDYVAHDANNNPV